MRDAKRLSGDDNGGISDGGRTLVLGDVHGAHRALVQVLERSAFDRSRDRLIFLGDVADAWPQTRECIDELLGIPNLVAMIGNHDQWFQEWAEGGSPDFMWVMQGGKATIASYGFQRDGVPPAHREYLKRAKLWHEEDGRIFLHGGWPWHYSPHPMGCPDLVTWDRELWTEALLREQIAKIDNSPAAQITMFREVYVGHTTTTRAGFTEPAHQCEVWNMDQGAGYEGRLSIMDIDTKEFWQSDPVGDLYPGVTGRPRPNVAPPAQDPDAGTA